MIPASLFNNSITIQTRSTDTSDPMEVSEQYTNTATMFAMISMPSSQTKRNYAQEFNLIYDLKFTVRGIHEYPVGSTRILWKGQQFLPVKIAHNPGIYRNESLTYFYASKDSGLTEE